MSDRFRAGAVRCRRDMVGRRGPHLTLRLGWGWDRVGPFGMPGAVPTNVGAGEGNHAPACRPLALYLASAEVRVQARGATVHAVAVYELAGSAS